MLHAWNQIAAAIYPSQLHAQAPRLCARLIGLGRAFWGRRKTELPGNDSFLSFVCLFALTHEEGSLFFFPGELRERNPTPNARSLSAHGEDLNLGLERKRQHLGTPLGPTRAVGSVRFSNGSHQHSLTRGMGT